jgi:WD40 repeat protein
MFAPPSSLVRQRLSHELPPWISRIPQKRNHWNEDELTIEASNEYSMTIAFSPDGLFIASGGSRGVRFWDAATGESCGPIMSSNYYIQAMTYSPNGRVLAYSCHDGDWRYCVFLCDVATQAVRNVCTLEESEYWAPSIAFAPNSELLTIGRTDYGVRLFNTKTMGATDWSCDLLFDPCFSFSPDGGLLAVIVYDSIRLWDVGRRELIIDLTQSFGGRKAGLFSPVENVFAF